LKILKTFNFVLFFGILWHDPPMSGLLTQLSASNQLQLKAPVQWAVERKFRHVDEPSATVPFTLLLLDRQYYLAQSACFVRHIRQVHHREAIESLSQINIPFAHDHENLIVHWIRIWRAGEVIDQVASVDELTVVESKQANRLITRSTLQDLRPTDSIDVAYTLKAHTPSRRFSAVHPQRQRVPICDWYVSAIAQSEVKIYSHCTEENLEPVVKKLSEGSRFYQWSQRDVPAIRRVDNAPIWLGSSPELQLSNTQSWPKIAADIYRRWEIPHIGADGAARAQDFTDAAADDLWEAARLASRFIQNEITTLPTHALTQSPVEPGDAVIESNAGDAKSKACLLVQFLRTFGIPAAPVLVSKTRMRTLSTMLPASDLFDHVVVRAHYDDQDFWIDPTATFEAGPIRANSLRPYGVGLQVSPKTTKLCAVPPPNARENLLTITEHFKVAADGSAELKVTSKTTGTDANSLRKQLATISPTDFQEQRLTEMQSRYPRSSPSSKLKIREASCDNEITLEEHLEIPSLLVGEHTVASFTPTEILRNLPRNIGQSSTPYALNFPCNVRYLIVIDTPWQAGASESAERSTGTAFTFSYKHSASDQRHTLRYAFSTLDDHIIPVDFDSVRMRIDALRPHLDYRFAPPLNTGARREKSAKGARIIKQETDDSSVRKRKSDPTGAGIGTFMIPIVGVIAAIGLVLGVKASFQGKAVEASTKIINQNIEERENTEAWLKSESDTQISKYTIPDDPRELLPPIPPIQSSSELDQLEFGIGSGEAREEEKASQKKNATSGDWKLSN
jgi:hypothetical protein